MKSSAFRRVRADGASAWRGLPETIRRLVLVDVRRPASWIASAAGIATGLGVTVAEPHAWAVGWAFMLTAAAVVAAIGELPLETCRTAVDQPAARLAGCWACERAAWPLLGGGIAAAVSASSQSAWAVLAAAALLSAVLVITVILVTRLSGATAADASAVAIVLAGCGATAAIAARGLGVGHWEGLAAAVAASCLAGLFARALAAQSGSQWPTAVLVTHVEHATASELGRSHLDALPGGGGIHHLLQKVAMATALAAMAGWLILQDDRRESRDAVALGWAALSAAWFVCLSVPRATLLDGVCGSAAWVRLFRSAAPSPKDGAGPWSPAGLPPGPIRFGLAASAASAAILGWPPLVCGLLSLSRPTYAWPPLAIVVALVLAASFLAGIVVVGGAGGAAGESLCAVALAFAIAAAVISVRVICPAPGTSDPRPASTSLIPPNPPIS